MTQIDESTARLNTHEAVCAERYAGLESRMHVIDQRFDKLEAEVKDLKDTTMNSLSEIKTLIEAKQNSSMQKIIAVTGTIITSLAGLILYLITHAK